MVFSLTFFIGATGCASVSLENRNEDRFSFQSIGQLMTGSVTKSTALGKWGPAKERNSDSKMERWIYFDRETGNQRLTLTFSTQDGALKNVLWVPQSDEPEISISELMSHYPRSNFATRKNTPESPHSISTATTFTDAKLGISILYDNATKRVDGVSWSDPRDMNLANSEEK